MKGPKLSQVDLIAIFGKRKSGKTTLCKTLQKSFPRVVVIDLMREYSQNECDYIAQNIDDFARVLIAITKSGSQKFKIALQFNIESGRDEKADFDTAMQLLYSFGNCMVVVEEIHHYMRGEWVPPWLKNIILVGRHRKLGVMATSQKPATVSKMYTSQCEHWFISRMFERNDQKYFEESTIGENTKILVNLKPYHFLWHVPPDFNRIIQNS